jgi:hypothetical protein
VREIQLFIIFMSSLVQFDCQANESDIGLILSKTVSEKHTEIELNTLTENASWNDERTAFTTFQKLKQGTYIAVFIKQNDGSYTLTDISIAETYNFGAIGHKREYYDKYKSYPSKWSVATDGFFLDIQITTQAWKDGQRFTYIDRVRLKQSGSPSFC